MNKIINFFLEILNRSRDVQNFKMVYHTIVIPNIGRVNKNGRIYTMESIEKMWGEFKNMYGQIDNPTTDNIQLHNISHQIHRTFIHNNDLWAEYSILNNDNGKGIYDLFKFNIGFLRPMGRGNIIDSVVKDYELISFNFLDTDSFKSSSFININP